MKRVRKLSSALISMSLMAEAIAGEINPNGPLAKGSVEDIEFMLSIEHEAKVNNDFYTYDYEVRFGGTTWRFTRPGHLGHPSVLKSTYTDDGDFQVIDFLCEAEKTDCKQFELELKKTVINVDKK